MTNSQLYEWGYYINPENHGTFIIDSNDRESALKHLLETLGAKSLPEYAVLHCWTTDHPTLEAHELQAENEHLKECLELRANAVKTYTDLYHEAQAKLAMMSEAIQLISETKFTTYKARNRKEVGIEDNNGEMCYIIPADSISKAQEALSATAEDVERWKAEQRKAVAEEIALKLEALADKNTVERAYNLIYATWIRDNA